MKLCFFTVPTGNRTRAIDGSPLPYRSTTPTPSNTEPLNFVSIEFPISNSFLLFHDRDISYLWLKMKFNYWIILIMRTYLIWKGVIVVSDNKLNRLVNPFKCSFSIEARPFSTRYKSGSGIRYPTLTIDPRRFLKWSQLALSNSTLTPACETGHSLYHVWCDLAGARTHDLLHERWTH